MTAHGAKGLQAPVVILCRCDGRPHPAAPRTLVQWTPEPGATPIPIFPPPQQRAGRAARRGDRRDRDARIGGALAVILCRRDPRGGAAGDRRCAPVRARKACRPKRAGMRRPIVPSRRSGSADAEGARCFLGARDPAPARRRADIVRCGAACRTLARLGTPCRADRGTALAPAVAVVARGGYGERSAAPAPAAHAAAEAGPVESTRCSNDCPRSRQPIARMPRGAGLPRQAGSRRPRYAMISSPMSWLSWKRPEFADLFGPDALAEAPIAATIDDGVVVAGTRRPVACHPRHDPDRRFQDGAARSRDARRHSTLSPAADGGLCCRAGGRIFPGGGSRRGCSTRRARICSCYPKTCSRRTSPGFAATEQS